MYSTLMRTFRNVNWFISEICTPILLSDIIDKIRVLNCKLYSFLKHVKASKLVKFFDPGSVSSDTTGTANESNIFIVFTIPPDLPLSHPERSVLAKGLKFVPNSGPIDLFSIKENTEAFFCHLRLKAHFHNQSSTYNNKDIFEQDNPKKSSWSPPEGQFSSLDRFVRQCRHDIDQLNHSRQKRSSNLSTDELLAFKSLRIVGMTLL